MLNLVHWRQRASRQRSVWLIRWCGLLTLTLAIVTGSVAVALDSLQRDVSDDAAALLKIQQEIQSLEAEIKVIDGKIAEDSANQMSLRRTQSEMQRRAAQWDQWFADRLLRVISIEQTGSELRLTIQAISPAVVSDLMTSPSANIVSIRSLDSGQLIEVQVHATQDE